jgi:hypothetical protein
LDLVEDVPPDGNDLRGVLTRLAVIEPALGVEREVRGGQRRPGAGRRNEVLFFQFGS